MSTPAPELAAAEAALRASEARYQRLVQHIGDAVVVGDLQGNIVFANERFFELLGLSPNQISSAGMKLQDHVAPQYHGTLQQQRERAMADGASSVVFEYEAVDHSGRSLWLEARTIGIRDGDQPQGTQMALRDISEKREAMAAQRAQQMAQQAGRAKGEFIAQISHELRTPLNAILGFAEILMLDQQHALASEQRRRVERMQRAGNHLLLLINEPLDLSRIEAGVMQLQLEDIDALQAMREAQRDLMPLADARKVSVTLHHDHDAGAGLVRGDAMRLRQVVHQLLSKMLKARNSGDRIELRIEQDSAQLRMVVADHGLASDAAQRQTVFAPQRAREVSADEGAGIGLAVSHFLVELMGGRLSALHSSRIGCGYEIELPALPSPAAAGRVQSHHGKP